jgi:hypothetical protein
MCAEAVIRKARKPKFRVGQVVVHKLSSVVQRIARIWQDADGFWWIEVETMDVWDPDYVRPLTKREAGR